MSNTQISYSTERLTTHISTPIKSVQLFTVFLFSTVISSLLLLVVMAPDLFFNLLLDGYVLFYFEEVVQLIASKSGMLGLVLTGLYATSLGLLFTVVYNTIISIHSVSVSSVLPALPSILLGCGGCGFGVLALLGFSGLSAAIPFGGNTLRLFGIIFVIISLGFIQLPENSVCRM